MNDVLHGSDIIRKFDIDSERKNSRDWKACSFKILNPKCPYQPPHYAPFHKFRNLLGPDYHNMAYYASAGITGEEIMQPKTGACCTPAFQIC